MNFIKETRPNLSERGCAESDGPSSKLHKTLQLLYSLVIANSILDIISIIKSALIGFINSKFDFISPIVDDNKDQFGIFDH